MIKLHWELYRDNLYRTKLSYKSIQPWLEMYDSRPAQYTIVYNEYTYSWMVTWWHGNRGFGLDHYAQSLEEGKQICQKHLKTMLSYIISFNK